MADKKKNALSALRQKFPAVPDVHSLSEEQKAWLQMKIQQFRECMTKTKFSSKPSWWEPMRISRNKTAHQTEDFSDEEFSDLCKNLFSNIEKISSDLQANIKRYRQQSKKKRKFENFASSAFGSENDRKQLVDAMEDMIEPVAPKEVKIEFPKSDTNDKIDFAKIAEDTLSEILHHKTRTLMHFLMRAFLRTYRPTF